MIHKTLIKDAIEHGKCVSISAVSYPARVRETIQNILEMYFTALDRVELLDHISYCVHELAGNAVKANSKRVYFEESQLNMLNPEEYKEGMQYFKEKALTSNILSKQKAHNLFIRCQFKRLNSGMQIAVRNNVPLHQREIERILHKLKCAENHSDLTELYDKILENEEGSGLGLAMMSIMLRNLGFENALRLFYGPQETVAFLHLNM